MLALSKKKQMPTVLLLLDALDGALLLLPLLAH
jgi:hypothetical protein